MKSRYMPILYVGMVFAAFAAGFRSLDRLSRSLPRNPVKTQAASAFSAEVPQATLSDIRNALEKQEYHISYDAQKKKLQSPNRRNNIRAYYEPGKLTVQTRVDSTGDGFKVELVNEGVFADGELLYAPQANARAGHHENKVQISHNAFTEEFINNEDGVRQNFIIESAPEGTRQLRVKMKAKGLKVAQGSGNELRFYSEARDGHTRNELVYNDLRCWDAHKKPLNAALAYVDNRIQISVDVVGAAYPVTIDPIIANGTPQNANKVLEINQSTMHLGFSVSSAGDVNGDGYSDVLIAAYLYDDSQFKDQGKVALHLGSSNGIDPVPIRTFYGSSPNDQLGSSVACAGDVNGDGYSDILLGAQYYDNGQFNEGGVFVYHGSKNGVIGDPAATLESNQIDGWFGTAVASAGDVNGDGYSDIVIGCYTFDNGQTDEGHAFIYHGGAEGIGTNGATQISGGDPQAKTGASVASAGDVDSDGFDDVLVGAPYYDLGEDNEGVAFLYYGSISGLTTNTYVTLQENKPGARLGTSVSGAGDVNGDGYDDVVVGADGYSNGQDYEGAFFVYHGSSAGLGSQSVTHFERNVADSYMGGSIARAGDVNKDGYADIIVGSAGVNSAYVYQGSSSGITGNPTILQILNQPNTHFGKCVASAGDVNGDGYSDVIVGADLYSQGENNEGAAFIFHGTSAGIVTNAAATLQSNQIGALMGRSVAGAGDINADGYSDVIVGAPDYDKGETNEGVAFIYYGAPIGITDVSPATILEINQNGAFFASEVASAGDVNGDGYSDVILGTEYLTDGQQYEGAAYVFHGSPSGIKLTSSFTMQSDIVEARYGSSVAAAGDVNGDGYSDVIVGAPEYSNGQISGGSAFVYYGNNSKGLKNNVRLFNTDLSASPLNHTQFSQPNFVGSLFSKSFIGKSKGKLVWETMGAGVPFSKIGNNSITTSNLFTNASGNFTNLTVSGSILAATIAKTGVSTKLRVRVRYSPALAITGQIYGPWRYLQSQMAGYNNAPVPEEAMAETIKRKTTDIDGDESRPSVVPYPNPVSDKLFIKAENAAQVRSVRFYTPNGKLLYQSQNAAAEMDVRNLDPGIYVLLVTLRNGTQSSHKVIVKK